MPRVKPHKNYTVLCENGDDRPAANVEVYAKTESEALNKAKELVQRVRYTVIAVSEIRE